MMLELLAVLGVLLGVVCFVAMVVIAVAYDRLVKTAHPYYRRYTV